MSNNIEEPIITASCIDTVKTTKESYDQYSALKLRFKKSTLNKAIVIVDFLLLLPNFNNVDYLKIVELVCITTNVEESKSEFSNLALVSLYNDVLVSKNIGNLKSMLLRTEEILLKTLSVGYFSIGVRQGDMHTWNISAFGGYISNDLLSILTFMTGKNDPRKIRILTSEKILLLFEYIDLVFKLGSTKLSNLYYNMALKTFLINPEIFNQVSEKILRNDQSFTALLQRQDALIKRFA